MAANSPTADGLRVAVIGGSLGGLLAANMLHRAGCDVTVHERIGEALSERGAGIATHDEMFDAFGRAGVDVNDAIGMAVEDRIVLARDGSVAARHKVRQVMCSWGSLLALLRAAARANLAPQFAEMVGLVETPFFQSIVDTEEPNMVSGRAVLLGDAAFMARPHCGMGVTKAAGDAVLLAELIAAFPDDIGHALQIFDAERCRYGRYIAAHSRRLGSQMKQSYASEEERIEAEYYRRPETCLREISLPPDPP